MGNDNVHISMLKSTPVVVGRQADPHSGRARAEERERRGGRFWPWGWRPRDAACSRRRDDQGVNVTMLLVADRRSMVIVVASFVCKTSVGQHQLTAIRDALTGRPWIPPLSVPT